MQKKSNLNYSGPPRFKPPPWRAWPRQTHFRSHVRFKRLQLIAHGEPVTEYLSADDIEAILRMVRVCSAHCTADEDTDDYMVADRRRRFIMRGNCFLDSLDGSEGKWLTKAPVNGSS